MEDDEDEDVRAASAHTSNLPHPKEEHESAERIILRKRALTGTVSVEKCPIREAARTGVSAARIDKGRRVGHVAAGAGGPAGAGHARRDGLPPAEPPRRGSDADRPHPARHSHERCIRRRHGTRFHTTEQTPWISGATGTLHSTKRERPCKHSQRAPCTLPPRPRRRAREQAPRAPAPSPASTRPKSEGPTCAARSSRGSEE